VSGAVEEEDKRNKKERRETKWKRNMRSN